MGADYGSFDPFIYTKVRINRSQPRYLYYVVRVIFNINNGGLIRVCMFIWSLTLMANSFSGPLLWEHVVVLKRTESLWFLVERTTCLIRHRSWWWG